MKCSYISKDYWKVIFSLDNRSNGLSVAMARVEGTATMLDRLSVRAQRLSPGRAMLGFEHRHRETLVMPKHPAFVNILFDASVAFVFAAPVKHHAPSVY